MLLKLDFCLIKEETWNTRCKLCDDNLHESERGHMNIHGNEENKITSSNCCNEVCHLFPCYQNTNNQNISRTCFQGLL